jgi:hypothetical protein
VKAGNGMIEAFLKPEFAGRKPKKNHSLDQAINMPEAIVNRCL